MSGEELREVLAGLGLSQRALARELGVDPTTVYRWVRGTLLVPKYAEAFLDLGERLKFHTGKEYVAVNAERRKTLAKAGELLSQARDLIEQVASDEREYYDNMPEGFQSSERGERADKVATVLEELCETLDEASGSIDDAQE